MDWRRDIRRTVGGAVVAPKKLARLRVEADDAVVQELDVLPAACGFDDDGRGVCRGVAAWDCGFPDRLAARLVERDYGRLGSAGSDDQRVAVDQRRLGVGPIAGQSAKIAAQTLAPELLAGSKSAPPPGRRRSSARRARRRRRSGWSGPSGKGAADRGCLQRPGGRTRCDSRRRSRAPGRTHRPGRRCPGRRSDRLQRKESRSRRRCRRPSRASAARRRAIRRSKPVSLETPLRWGCGPRHWGQSAATAVRDRTSGNKASRDMLARIVEDDVGN